MRLIVRMALISLLLLSLWQAYSSHSEYLAALRSLQAVEARLDSHLTRLKTTVRADAVPAGANRSVVDKSAKSLSPITSHPLNHESRPVISADSSRNSRPPKLSQLLAKNSDLRDNYLDAYRMSLPLQWRLFFSENKLSPDAITRFYALKEQRFQAGIQYWADHSTSPDASSTQADFINYTATLDSRLDSELRLLLGPEVFDRYKAFLDVASSRQEVSDFSTIIYHNGLDALTAKQATDLAEILNVAKANYKVVGGATIGPNADDFEGLLSKAKNILSPDQLSLFEGFVSYKIAKDKFFHVQPRTS